LEQALMLIAIAIMVIILVTAMGQPIRDMWSAVSGGLST
jgi:Flp pilus assembly pilin Flp